jgi:hypothetical protein
MRIIGDDGQYHKVPIKLSKEGGRLLLKEIEEQRTKKMDYTGLFKDSGINAKSRV